MKLNTQVYIDLEDDLSKDPNYQRLELFDFESIELTSTIQDVRDIAAIFTDFSQTFNVPASRTNNKVLGHFYSLSLLDGFDARIKRRGYIALNGITFRNGFIRLSESKVKNGKPYSYSITFFGAMVSLKDILGNDKLTDLGDLNKYNHRYSEDTVFNAFKLGLGLDSNDVLNISSSRDVIYPAISCADKWYYDSSTSSDPIAYRQGISTNIFYDGFSPATRGISFTQLKPAIKLIRIIEAIESKYQSITFSRDFFGSSQFNSLYMLMHKTKGELPNALDVEDTDTALLKRYIITPRSTGDASSRFSPTGSDEELRPLITSEKEIESRDYRLTVNITSATPVSGNYTITAYADGEVLASKVDVVGDNSLEFDLSSKQTKEWTSVYFDIEADKDQLTSYVIDLDIETTFTYVDSSGVTQSDTVISNYETPQSTESILSEIIIPKFIPKMDVLDFLRGLFKMFNLTAYVEDGVIVVKTLNDFYLSGSDVNISDKVDTSEINIKRAELYSNIDFRFSEPNTFGIINQNERLNDDYGNLEYKAKEGSLVFDGKKYEIKLPFEKVFYERLSDENVPLDKGDDRPSFGYGWLVDEDEEPTDTAPIIFYNIPTDVVNGTFGFKGAGSFTKYNRPSNILSNKSLSIHFGSEIDNYYSELINDSLFKSFYQDYILNLFNKTTRIVNYSVVFNLSTLLTYKMNDRIFVNGNSFRINSIKTNLNTGVSDLELITDYNPAQLTIFNDTEAPTSPNDLTVVDLTNNSATVTWTSSVDNLAVTGYKIYRNDSLIDTLGDVNEYTLTGLTSSTGYGVQVSAIDGAGNESEKTISVGFTTLATPDTVAPSNLDADANLSFVSATKDSFIVTWSGYTDNVGVTNYEIYIDTVLTDTIGTETSYEATGLSSSTSYNVQVKALDGAGNASALSTPALSVTTRSADEQAPTQPTINNYDVFINRVQFNWNASTDNVAVTGYKVYVDANPAIDVGLVLSYNLIGLTGNTSYSIRVSAYDAEGNESIKSSPLNITTL